MKGPRSDQGCPEQDVSETASAGRQTPDACDLGGFPDVTSHGPVSKSLLTIPIARLPSSVVTTGIGRPATEASGLQGGPLEARGLENAWASGGERASAKECPRRRGDVGVCHVTPH